VARGAPQSSMCSPCLRHARGHTIVTPISGPPRPLGHVSCLSTGMQDPAGALVCDAA
jgi:hypothetical protein